MTDPPSSRTYGTLVGLRFSSFQEGFSWVLDSLAACVMVLGRTASVDLLSRQPDFIAETLVGFAGSLEFGERMLPGASCLSWPRSPVPNSDEEGKPMAHIVTASMKGFLEEWATLGGPVARYNGFPVSAMLACAAVESAWGTGRIFRATLNPFSLQKWPHISYPSTHRTHWQRTVVKNGPPRVTAVAPFVCAFDQGDAVRQWCEWIRWYGEVDGPPQDQDSKVGHIRHSAQVAAKERLLALYNAPVAFARGLSTVGFGEDVSKGEDYARNLTDFSMTDYDTK